MRSLENVCGPSKFASAEFILAVGAQQWRLYLITTKEFCLISPEKASGKELYGL